jgi:hypothetical protein
MTCCGDRWHCETVINLFHVSARLDIYAPGFAPLVAWGPGPFSYHAVATGVTWTVSTASLHPTYESHDWAFIGTHRGTVRGSVTEHCYWLYFPFVPFAILPLSAAVLVHWTYDIRARCRAARQGLCPTCRYDLHAHHAGQKCPECGVLISHAKLP